jgi:hypothetical protein
MARCGRLRNREGRPDYHTDSGGMTAARVLLFASRERLSLRGAPIQGAYMLWTIVAILAVLWLLGLIGNVGGSLIHLLLVVAVVVVVLNLLSGRRTAH